MNELTIKLDAPELTAAITKLAGALLDEKALAEIVAAQGKKNQAAGSPAPVQTAVAPTVPLAAASATPAPLATAPVSPVAPMAGQAPGAIPARPPESSSPAPVAPTAPAPSFTVEQVGKAGADLIAANPAKMGELLALLAQFGVPAITALKQEQLGLFVTALRGLGGKL